MLPAFCFYATPRSQAQDAAAAVPALQVIYLDDEPLKITTEEFRKLPRTKVEAKDKDGKPVAYTGVALHHLLNETQTPLAESLRAGALLCYLSVEAKDGYRVLFSLPEIDPAFTDRTILLADELNSKPLDERNGPYQIIVPDEKRHARWVRMVETIRILESKVPSDASVLPARQLPQVDPK
jgi:hypothetical protein